MGDTCDVCIVGAGLAGMNALFVASRYLARGQKVILIDRRPGPGGMWLDAYRYVRLHQPHPMFTAGNIGWTLGRERAHLADRREILEHFQHCVADIERRVTVDERYGWALESDEETSDGVQVVCRDPAGETRVIHAGKLIKAYGFSIQPNEPLALSSERVSSVSPDFCDIRDGEIGRSDAPVWVIGGGKTAMDTAHALITNSAGREVNLLAGSGMIFTNRDRFFPAGAQRWWGGTSLNGLALALTRRFDGTNEDDVRDWFLARYGLTVTPQARHLMLGVLSERERQTIADGLNDVLTDHLVDVVDRNGATDLLLRSGATKSIEPGSWIVNCTGYLGRHERPYEPYVSPSGAVLSVNMRSAALHFSSYSAYFLTHLLFLDKLGDIPIYALDLQDLMIKAKQVLPFAMFTLAQHNLGLIADAVPGKVFSECGLDFNLWYPWHRRTASNVQFLLTHRRERAHLQRTLDTVAERFGVRCAPLELAQA